MTAKKTAKTADEKTTTPKREVEAHAPKNRPKRRPLSTTYRLMLPDGVIEEGYEYRWLLDRVDRIHMFEAAWWQKVVDGKGKAIRKPAGKGDYLILYRIESKFAKEDREAKQKKTINLLKQKAQIQKADQHSMEYVPEGHEGVLKIS